MLFEKSNFAPIHTGKADPSRYLIIGFDTEYQRYADDETKTLISIFKFKMRIQMIGQF